ncbi:hypothetical protein PMJ10TS2_73340 [Paenibacillus melissococcoides]
MLRTFSHLIQSGTKPQCLFRFGLITIYTPYPGKANHRSRIELAASRGNLMLVVPALLLFVLAQRHIMQAFVYSTK